jgi:hypothetical protein
MMTVAESLLSAALIDSAMIFAVSGREREMGEFERLVQAADLEIRSVTPLHPPCHLIEVCVA